MQTILSYPKLIKHVKKRFAKIPDLAKRARTISLADHLITACALFLLKYPSLLKFDQDAHQSKLLKYNLKSVYHIKNIPSDTHMREIRHPYRYRESFSSFRYAHARNT